MEKPQPFTIDLACYGLGLRPIAAGSSAGTRRRRAWRGSPVGCAGRSLGSRDRGRNRQLPDDIRGIAQRFQQPGYWSNTSPDTPVWVVEIKGSRGTCAAAESRGST